MRCEKCGVEIDDGTLCDACLEAPLPRTRRKKPWSCIVASVIAGLAVFAVIWPVMVSCGCEHAGKTKSLNNIKQLGIAVQTYSQDYNETFPGWLNTGRAGTPTYIHNCWDKQIDPQVKSKDVYSNGETGIRSPTEYAATKRTITYGLNGLLITPPKAQFDGDADFASVNSKNPPAPSSPGALGNPAGTILFAELSTKSPMPAPYSGWIDISPKAFVEIAHAWRTNPYQEPYGRNADSGIARALWTGGGVYAFADGHVKFMKIGTSVGIGTTVGSTLITADNCWSATNTKNMWNPQ